MGWFLRKSIRLGPPRLNLSKRGAGGSVGVEGLRAGGMKDIEDLVMDLEARVSARGEPLTPQGGLGNRGTGGVW